MKRAQRILGIVSLGTLMTFLIAACHKDPTPEPQPTPDQPTDTITPIIPTREIVLDWDWTRPSLWTRSNVVESYATQPDVKSIEIKFIPANTSGYGVKAFNLARDSLDLCASKKPDIITWTGTIVVGSDGASLPSNATGMCGMYKTDSIRFAQFGANIIRYNNWNGLSK